MAQGIKFFLLTFAIFVMEAFNIICWEVPIQLIFFSFSFSFMQCASKGARSGNKLVQIMVCVSAN